MSIGPMTWRVSPERQLKSAVRMLALMDARIAELEAALAAEKASHEVTQKALPKRLLTQWRVINRHLRREFCEPFNSEAEALAFFNKPYNVKSCIRVEREDAHITVIADREGGKP